MTRAEAVKCLKEYEKFCEKWKLRSDLSLAFDRLITTVVVEAQGKIDLEELFPVRRGRPPKAVN